LPQSEAILKSEGISDEVISQYHSLQDELYAILKKEEDREVAADLLRDTLGQSKEILQEVSHVEDGESVIPGIVQQLNSDWYRYYIAFDPSTYIRQVKVPLLALNGSLDQQVPVDTSLPLIASMLEEEGHEDFTTVELPELNHLFQTCKTGNPTEYQEIEETISPIALETMSEWIHNHLKF